MQLLETDTDIDVQVKMSTIQQESLEKFSLIEAMCDNMSEVCGSDESSRNGDAFELSKEKVDETIAQNIAISHEPNLNEKNCADNDELSGKGDEESTDRKINSKPEEYQNTPIVDKAKKNCDIVNKPVISNKEEIELEVSCVNKLENMNNSDIENRNNKMQPNSVLDNNVIDKAEDQEAKDTIAKDFKTTSDIENKMAKLQEDNIEMQVSLQECEKVESNEKTDATANKINENSLIEDKINSAIEEGIELNVTIKENNKVKLLTEHSSGGSQNEESTVMDVLLKEHDKIIDIEADRKIVNETQEKIGEKIDNDIDMDVTLEDQNKVNIEVAKNNITVNYTENNTVNQKEENSVMNVPLQGRDEEGNSVIENKIENETTCSSKMEDKFGEAIEEGIEIGVTLKAPDDVNTVVKDKNVEEINERFETEVESEKLIEKDIVMSVTLEDRSRVKSIIDDNFGDVNMTDNSEIGDKNADAMEVSVEEHCKDGTEDKNENKIVQNIEKSFVKHTENSIRVEEMKEASETKDKSKMNVTIEKCKEINSETEDSIKESKTEEKEREANENDDVLDELKGIVGQIQDKLEEQNILENDISEMHGEQAETGFVADKQEQQNSEVDKKIEDQERGKLQDKDEKEPSSETSERKDKVAIVDKGSSDENNQQKSKDDSGIGNNNELSIEIPQVGKNIDKSERIRDVEDENKIADEQVIGDTKKKIELKDHEKNLSVEVSEIRMDTDEVIDIADEKEEEVNERQSENIEKTTVSIEKLDVKTVDSNEVKDNVAFEIPVRDANVQQLNEKKKLTHISKLSNTLDILSDEEDDQPKGVPQKGTSTEMPCTSINLDDDDDVMLIDEDTSPNESDEKKTDVIAEPELEKTEDFQKEETKIVSEDKEEQSIETSENKTDTTPTEVAALCTDEKKSSDPEQGAKKDEVSEPKKPLVYGNFLKTYKKNLAEMTRDELEEFCILKIVEGVVDRSNLGDIKSQLKALAHNIEEYKKKTSTLSKQNRDLQVVLKSVQEEQKKKTNMPITPLKITRSVGMQVLMNDDKGPARKKVQGANTNAANSVPNRQGKAAQNQTKQKGTNNNTATIPVPRLVPAVNNSNLNTVKAQSPNANTTAKPQGAPVNNSPVQSVSNGLPATPAQRPEKRPHSRMQQSNSFTVDLTDDEPPAKAITRNANAPVRLVPPQNLLAPNRQPFGANVSSPRKVYIPISGSQGQVAGVRPGQTIMLRAISPQGPRQRQPTAAVAKPNQTPNTIRVQRVPSRHPAPLPDSVKQYQPLNWKALPPAPELKLSKVDNGIVISWTIHGYQEDNYEEIASYQLYAYQETSSPPSTALWKKIGDVKALPLPMACTLTQFMAGYKYYFAVRAVDIRSRLGPFSLPGSILLLNKM